MAPDAVKILIVDDSKVMRSLVRRSLREAGYGGHDVIEAANGKEALAQVEGEGPQLILSDWNMPEMNGLAFLQALREGGNETTFGFVTSEATSDMRQQAVEAGASFLIAKPFKPKDLADALAKSAV